MTVMRCRPSSDTICMHASLLNVCRSIGHYLKGRHLQCPHLRPLSMSLTTLT